MLGCSQIGGTVGCPEICQWTGPPPVACPVSATLGGAPARTLGGAPAKPPEAVSDCSDSLTAAYDMCNSTSEMIRETSDGKVEGKKIQNDQKEDCCCILTISIAGEDINKALSNVFSPENDHNITISIAGNKIITRLCKICFYLKIITIPIADEAFIKSVPKLSSSGRCAAQWGLGLPIPRKQL